MRYVLLPLVVEKVNFLSVVLVVTLICLLQMSEKLQSVLKGSDNTFFFEILHHNIMVKKAETEDTLPKFGFWL